MSAQFEKGDRVVYVGHVTPSLVGAKGTIKAEPHDGHDFKIDWDVPNTDTCCVAALRLRKIEPEWTVGQKVSGDDYVMLPVGSVVLEDDTDDTVRSVPIAKTSEYEWTNQGWPGVFLSADLAGDVRTLTKLGDGTPPQPGRVCSITAPHIHGTIVGPGGITIDGTLIVPTAEPEDIDAEPLKEGDWVQVWEQVRDPEPDYDGEIQLRLDRLGAKTEDRLADAWARPDAIVRPADGAIPPWVKEPEPEQCASLKSRVNGSFVRCDLEEHDASTDRGNNAFGTSWTDAEAYGRVEVSS